MSKNKRGIFRGDIYWTDLRSVGIAIDHPCVIITNWKNNIKSNYVTVLRLTSQEKSYNATHFDLDTKKYGLKKDYSCILAEEIFTLDKKYLKEKLCKLDNLDMLEVDKLLSMHLQLFDGKYNYLDDSDLEELFIEENFIIKHKKEEIIKLKVELYDLLEKDKDYNKCLLKSYELIDMVKGNDDINSNDLLHYIYHIQSKCYLKIKDWNNCLDKAKLSLKHMNRPTQFSYEYSICLWTCGRAYEELKQIESSKKIYSSLENYYKSNSYEIMAKSIAFNVARLENNINRMLEIKEDLVKLEANGVSYFTTKEYKDSVLAEMTNEINTLLGGV